MLTALMQAAAESEELDAASIIFTEGMDGMEYSCRPWASWWRCGARTRAS